MMTAEAQLFTTIFLSNSRWQNCEERPNKAEEGGRWSQIYLSKTPVLLYIEVEILSMSVDCIS